MKLLLFILALFVSSAICAVPPQNPVIGIFTQTLSNTAA